MVNIDCGFSFIITLEAPSLFKIIKDYFLKKYHLLLDLHEQVGFEDFIHHGRNFQRFGVIEIVI